MAFTVAIYLVDRACGGYEEGGWWYECGELANKLAANTRGFARENDANRYAEELNRSAVIAELNAGRPAISSVLSRGQYAAVVRQGLPAPFPATRPEFE